MSYPNSKLGEPLRIFSLVLNSSRLAIQEMKRYLWCCSSSLVTDLASDPGVQYLPGLGMPLAGVPGFDKNYGKPSQESGQKRPGTTDSTGGFKRFKPDEDILDLNYESDGELGVLASGGAVPRTRLDVEAAWKMDARFVRFGFEENIQLAPLRFRTHVTMQNVCGFCANTGHKSANKCKKRQRLVEECGKESGSWPEQCRYPYCEDPKKHLIAACTTLQSKCPKCFRRGHRADRCPWVHRAGGSEGDISGFLSPGPVHEPEFC